LWFHLINEEWTLDVLLSPHHFPSNPASHMLFVAFADSARARTVLVPSVPFVLSENLEVFDSCS
jgi:hypothetical protein